MSKKVLTKQCPSCSCLSINDDNEFQCCWGKSKKIKILEKAKGKAKICTLKR